MADEKNTDQEEYHYSEEEMVTPTPEPTERPVSDELAPREPFWKNRLVVIPIALVVGIGFVYWFLQEETKPQNQPPQATAPAKVTPKVEATKQPTVAPSVAPTGPTTGVADLQHQVANQEKEINSLQNEMKQNRQAMLQASQSVVKLGQQQAALTTQMTRLVTDVRKLEIGKKNSDYTVQSLLTGRAWLQSNRTGRLISVKVGDRVPGYGYILGINVGEGSVITSSGAVIPFGNN